MKSAYFFFVMLSLVFFGCPQPESPSGNEGINQEEEDDRTWADVKTAAEILGTWDGSFSLVVPPRAGLELSGSSVGVDIQIGYRQLNAKVYMTI
jgi:hypothetical protein